MTISRRIDDLEPAAPPDGTEVLHAMQGGTSVRVTPAQLLRTRVEPADVGVDAATVPDAVRLIARALDPGEY